MQRLLVLMILLTALVSGCRYWVLYKFADQFCDYDRYVALNLDLTLSKPSLEILFQEPVLDRPILLRYLHAAPYLSHYQENAVISRDDFAFAPLTDQQTIIEEPFTFSAGYHALQRTALLSDARLDPRLSSLFPPALVDPILRSICSDDYDLSDEQLDMRFQLVKLDKDNLPQLSQLEAILGKAHSINEQGHAYHFDFLLKDQQGYWQPQHKPVTLVFRFDPSGKLLAIHIDYFKYRYWLDIATQSGRLLVLRN